MSIKSVLDLCYFNTLSLPAKSKNVYRAGLNEHVSIKISKRLFRLTSFGRRLTIVVDCKNCTASFTSQILINQFLNLIELFFSQSTNRLDRVNDNKLKLFLIYIV